MPGIVTRKFRIHNAKQFKEAFSENDFTRMYLFIGRVTPWDNDSNPPTPIDSVEQTQYDHWRSMIGMKKVQPSDTSFVIPINKWLSGTVYDQYDSTVEDIYSKTFYVTTDEYNVYKCLFNNRGSQSTVKPTGTSTNKFTTSDGYVWKYMYTVSASDTIRFVTNSYIPVKTLEVDDSSSQWSVQQAASNGSIEIVDVVSNGSGYLVNKGTVQSVTNSSVLTIESTANTTDNIYNGSTLYISSGLGSGQIREIVDYSGSNKKVTLKTGLSITPNTSSTYHVGPNINISGDGSGALAYANVESSGIDRVNMINVGQDYSRATINVTANSSHGTGASLKPMISPNGGHGSDPVSELAGHNVMLNVRLDGSESDSLPSNNDFRTIGILKDPLLMNNSFANSSVYDLTTRFKVTSVSGDFQTDEFVQGGSSDATGRVVRFANSNASGTEGTLYLTYTNNTPFQNTETVTANTSGVTATINGLINRPVEVRQGDIIYIEYRGPVQRAEDQIEDIKLVTRF